MHFSLIKACFKHHRQLWLVGVLAMMVLTAVPIASVFFHVLQPAGEVWQHLVDTVLADYIANSLKLMFGTAVGVLVLGVPLAWLNSMCRFPGRRYFEWLLLLPMAMPSYIIGYTYTGILDYSGSVQVFLRDFIGWGQSDYFFPEVRSVGGAVIMLSLTLYPYVYLITRAAFISQSACALEAGATLGLTRWQRFFRIDIPLARPAVIAGLSLALMEVLADFGMVRYFGVQTFTTGIYRTWFGLGDVSAASQLAALLMVFVFALLLLERWTRHKARYYHTSTRYSRLPQHQLYGMKSVVACAVCALPLLFGFIVPVGYLLYWGLALSNGFDSAFFTLIAHSLALALSAALFVLVLAITLGYTLWRYNTPLVRVAVSLSSLGYAIPGMVIAIGVLHPFAWLDGIINAFVQHIFAFDIGLLVSGTFFLLLYAYNVRFLSVSLQTVSSGFDKIKPSLDEAGRSFGFTAMKTLTRIHMPIMKGAVITAVLMVFVDVLKELPITSVMRPFNFNTLAVRAFELASDERLADAALPSLCIVAAGIIPVIVLSHIITRSRAGAHAEH